MIKNVVFICDLGHAGHRIPGLALHLAETCTVKVVIPAPLKRQLAYLGVDDEEFLRLCESSQYPMRYQRFTYISSSIQELYLRTSRLIDQMSISKTINEIDSDSLLSGYKDILMAESEIHWIRPALDKIEELHRIEPFDAIISSVSPFVSNIIAYLTAKRLGIIWIADYRDMWSINYNQHFYNNEKIAFERQLLKHCSLSITATEGLRASLETIYEGPIHVIHNFFQDTNEAEIKNAKLGYRTIAYTGTLYKDFQEISDFLIALQIVNSGITKYVLEVCGFACNEIRQWYLENFQSLPSYVRLHNHVSKGESLEIQRSADILLFFDWKIDLGVESTKLIEYLPKTGFILAFGRHKSSRASQIISKTNRGRYFINKSEIVDFLTDAFADSALLFPTRNQESISEFSRSAQARVLSEILENGQNL